jgi:creatinine amidohydrolase
MNAVDKPVRWDELSWPDIAAVRARGIDLVILPVGATEQHGRHLPTGVDTFSALAVAEAVSARTGIPVLPALAYGCSLGHSDKWPGTFSLRPETLARVVVEIAEGVVAAGFGRMLLLNGHVTNWAPLRCGLENIRRDLPRLRIALRSVWELSRDVFDCYHADGGTNWHANDAETSLMLHLRPDLVRMDQAVDEPDTGASCFFSYTVDKESEHGGVGKPTRAEAARGEWLLARCAETLAAKLADAMIEDIPLVEYAKRVRTDAAK